MHFYIQTHCNSSIIIEMEVDREWGRHAQNSECLFGMWQTLKLPIAQNSEHSLGVAKTLKKPIAGALFYGVSGISTHFQNACT